MSFKQALRVLRLSIGKRLLDKKSGDSVKARRILFMRQDGKLGDYMVSSFCYREIKNYDPTIHIAVVCTKKTPICMRVIHTLMPSILSDQSVSATTYL